MIVGESVLKTLGVCGLVGAGTIAINEISRYKKSKKVVAKEIEDVSEEENTVDKEKSVSFMVDSAKLEKMLIENQFPKDKVKEFVSSIIEEATPDIIEQPLEIVEAPKAPTFTVIDEPVVNPTFTTEESKKPSTKKTTKANNKKIN